MEAAKNLYHKSVLSSFEERYPDFAPNLCLMLERCAERYPGKGIYYVKTEGEDFFEPYPQLYSRARRIAVVLQKRGFNPGDKLITLVNDDRLFINIFWGCILAGVVPAPLPTVTANDYEQVENKRLAGVLSILNSPVMCDSEKEKFYSVIHSIVKQQDKELLCAEQIFAEAEFVSHNDYEPLAADEYRTVIIQFSSGSTGIPKGVMLNSFNMIQNIKAKLATEQGRPKDVMAYWVPYFHDFGLFGCHLVSVGGGMNQVKMTPEQFANNPIAWLKKLDQYKATITCSTNTGIEFTCNVLNLRRNAVKDLDLSCVRVLLEGAEMVSVRAARKFVEYLAPNGFSPSALIFGYGLTETVLASALGSSGDGIRYVCIDREALHNQKEIKYVEEASPNSLYIARVGFPVPYSDVRIVDDDGKPCGNNVLGVVQLSGDNVTKGYYQNPEADREVFREGWFNTGDLGFTDDEGALYITGRAKEMIIINGHNYYPYDLEMIAASHSGDAFRALTICGIYDEEKNTEEVLCFFVPPKKGRENINRLLGDVKEAVNRLSGVSIHRFFKIRMSDIPRTTSGKISRRIFAEEYKKGAYCDKEVVLENQPSAVQRNDHEAVIRQIWREVLGLSDEDARNIAPHDSVFKLGCDSLQALSIQGRMEEHYGIRFMPHYCYRYPTLKEQTEYMEQRDFSKEPPQNELEALLLDVICGVLRIEEHELGVTEDFMSRASGLGEAVEMASKIKEAFAVGDEHNDILSRKSIRDMAKALRPIVLHTNDEQTLKRERRFPLMNFQETLYFHRKGFIKNEPSGLSCFIFMSVRMYGDFKREAFHEAYNRLIQYHPVLRAVIDETQGRPEMIILSSVPETSFYYEDISHMESSEQEAFLQSREIKNGDYRFEMDKFPLYFGEIFKLGDNEHVFMFNLEHLIIDGYSTLTLLEELFMTYESIALGRPAEFAEQPLDFKHYVSLEEIRQRTDKYKRALESQVNIFRDFPSNVQLPFKQNPSSIDEIFFDTLHRRIDGEAINSLNTIAKDCGVSLNSLLLAAYFKIMNLWGQQDDLIINMPIFNREHYFPGARRVIGTFIDIFPVRIRTSYEENAIEIAKKVESYVRNMLEVPVSSIVLSRLAAKANGIQPKSMSSIIFSNSIGLYGAQLSKLETLKIDNLSFRTGAPGTYIDLVLMDFEGGYYIDWNYVRGMFEDSFIETLSDQYEALLNEIINQYPLNCCNCKFTNKNLLPHAYVDLMSTVNSTDSWYPVKTFDAWVGEQAQKNPGAVALTFGEQSVTYGELDRRAGELAALLREYGAADGSFIALLQYRRPEMIVAQLAVWKAGAAYVPIDPAYPSSRIAYMIEDCGASILIAQNNCIDSLGEELPCNLKYIVVNDGIKACEARGETSILDLEDAGRLHNPQRLCNSSNPENLAYMIYTSGSTGKPKGVMITHKKLCNFIYWVQQYHGIDEKAQCAMVTSYSFDMTLASNWCPLVSGSTLHMLDEQSTRDPEKLLEFISNKRITFLNVTPSHFSLIANTRQMLRREFPISWELRVMLGGEVINTKDLNIWLEYYPDTHFTNEYGPTETTVASSYFTIPKNSENRIELTVIPIGKPLPNNQLYILNEAGELCMPGTVGCLYIGGDGVAKGYYGKPERTAQAFVPDKFRPDRYDTMYCTGDMARMLPDGNIEFFGRKDFQVNLRGYRIECGEVEQNLIEHPSVKEAVVTARSNKENITVLVAFYTSSDNTPIPDHSLKAFLKGRLPDYAVPAHFRHMESLPLTASGKLDIKGLPDVAVDSSAVSAGYEAPETEIQKRITALWEDLLNVRNIGIHDNFWDIGGDSLSAMRLVNKMKEEGFGEFALKDAFDYRTIASLSEAVEKQMEYSRSIQENISFLKACDRPCARILFFPNSSSFATAKMFSGLSSLLPHSIEVMGVNIPGHGNSKVLLTTVEEVVELFEGFISEKRDIPLYIAGYCFGCLPAFELTKRLEGKNCLVDGLIMLSSMAPDMFGKHYFPAASDSEMVDNMKRAGQAAVQMFAGMSCEEIALNCNIIRNDLNSMMTYKYSGKKICAPLYLLQGEKDQYIESTEYLPNWGKYAREVIHRVIPDADHLFLESHTGHVSDIITDIVMGREDANEKSLADILKI
ncbi:polyketide synthase PksJ [Anaerobacterium chartisolvens]|uniref:Polyketide synthase PksJ n=1 Tax=Anaerobacterium chartisolvens TaxID=1297424 RepID=A0A369BGN0_9FIRM|nr:non-ribosomal peptide synthetase [Anaerobacterium chartisolvens]RCX18844.1 polyketide synthase PksJ [Anaerobacterium chartisolvens]